jgi:hypothetical protein
MRDLVTNSPMNPELWGWTFTLTMKQMMQAPSDLVLWFILAIVVGYFAGRTFSIRQRSDRE